MFSKKIFFLFLLVLGAKVCFSQAQKIKVYAFVAEDCPISIFMAGPLKSIAERYAGTTEFYLVFPMSTSGNATAEQFKKENKLGQFIVKVDKRQVLTKKLGASVTPEVIVTGANDSILYKGRINDAYSQPGKKKHSWSQDSLGDALAYISDGKEVPKPWRPAVGCFITLEKE